MTSPFQPWANYARTLSLASTRDAQWNTISDLLRQAFGFQLFTSLLYLEDHRLMKRLYTSDETISPLGGFKATGVGPWSQRVLEQGNFYVARDEEDIRTVFSEASLLIDRGLHSAFNIPVRHEGRVIGSLNLLSRRHGYDEIDQDLAILIAGLCAPVFLQEIAAAQMAIADIDRSQLDSV